MPTDTQKIAEELTKQFTDKGKIIEAGWASLRVLAYPTELDAKQLREMRNIFFAGAHHLFASITSMLEPQQEITDNDIRRMDLIQKELDNFIIDYRASAFFTAGNA